MNPENAFPEQPGSFAPRAAGETYQVLLPWETPLNYFDPVQTPAVCVTLYWENDEHKLINNKIFGNEQYTMSSEFVKYGVELHIIQNGAP